MDSDRIIEAVMDEVLLPRDNAFDGIPVTLALTAIAMSGVCPECCSKYPGDVGIDDEGGDEICTNPYHDHREKLEAMLDE